MPGADRVNGPSPRASGATRRKHALAGRRRGRTRRPARGCKGCRTWRMLVKWIDRLLGSSIKSQSPIENLVVFYVLRRRLKVGGGEWCFLSNKAEKNVALRQALGVLERTVFLARLPCWAAASPCCSTEAGSQDSPSHRNKRWRSSLWPPVFKANPNTLTWFGRDCVKNLRKPQAMVGDAVIWWL